MRNLIVFVQSVSSKEWEVGEIISNEINHNPSYLDYHSIVSYIKTFQEFEKLLKSIIDCVQYKSMIIQIDAHSNCEGIAFKDINSLNKEECNDYVSWTNLYDILDQLYQKHGTSVSLIFLSCFSSEFVKSIKFPHMPIIAAEGKIFARRAEEQLIEFYKKICTGSTIKEAYEFMVDLYPIEDEMYREENDRSILKLFM